MADSAKLKKRGTLKKGDKISVASSYFNEKGRKDPYFGIVESNAPDKDDEVFIRWDEDGKKSWVPVKEISKKSSFNLKINLRDTGEEMEQKDLCIENGVSFYSILFQSIFTWLI